MTGFDSLDRTAFFRRRSDFAGDFSDPGAEAQYPPDLELEPIHLTIDLQFDLAAETAAGRVTNRVKARRDGPTELKLHAVDFEDVAVQDPGRKALAWQYDGKILTIHWADPFSLGEEREVEVAYRVTQPVDGLYFSAPNEAYPDQSWYVTSDHETERARHWLPCVDLPNVRTSLDLRLRAEARFTILTNGSLLAETDHGDGTKTAHWQLTELCPSYLICIAIGDLIRADDGVFNDGVKSIPVAYYGSLPHTPDDLQRTFGRTKPMLAWMTQKFAMPFPYPKYYQFALPSLGGAMENISLVSWNDRYVMDETLAPEISWFIDQVNVHEMAHSYFGDAIVCRDFAHAWLKESWATYIQQVWCEDLPDEAQAHYVFYDNLRGYLNEADHRYKRPVVTRKFKSSWQMYDAHLYDGGACRLHTLRCELGDEVFWAGTRDYLQRYHGKVVETDHFRHALEEHSGRSLGKFFDQWFHTAAYPDLNVTFNYDSKQQQGLFTIEQKQVDPEQGIPPFVLKTDLGWTIDGVDHDLPISLDQPRHVFAVAMAAKPEMVRFDPGMKILCKLSFNPGDPMLRRQLSQARDVYGRILAVNELAKTGKRVNIRAILDAWAAEPFWGVRREMANALGESNSEAAVAGLADLLAVEQDAMVLPTLIRNAGKYRDPGIAAALEARLKQGLRYVAAEQAYEALGAQRQGAKWKLLVKAANQTGYNGLAQSGALRGLAATRQAEAVDLLLDKVGYGQTSNRARPNAILALADIGRGQEKANRERIVERLVDLLRDPWRHSRRAAVFALSSMRAPEALDALEAYARSRSDQERAGVERQIASLRSEDKLDGSALKKQVEELRDKLRKLEDQFQKVQAKVEPEQS